MAKQTIFLTGASGRMGREVLDQLLQRRDSFRLVLLVLPTERATMARFEREKDVTIIWGDLTNEADVLRGVTGADYVLHVGGLVSPAADYLPERTEFVNLSAIRHIIHAMKRQSNVDEMKLVYIGTVAQTGDRNPPLHWGRVGDPIRLSAFDHYAWTKTVAEREVIESGLRYWVSLRQTGILYPELFHTLDPIMYHVPLNGVFEWVTAKDAGRLLANLCAPTIPESFWRNVYNIGGGAKWRTTNEQFLAASFRALGISDYRQVVERRWFATQNFHGQWYEDSDVLEQYASFRSQSFEQFMEESKEAAPRYFQLARFIPAVFLKKLLFERVARKPHGPLHWLDTNDEARIAAFFGSRAAWSAIPDWYEATPTVPSSTPQRLDHGYDETSPLTLDQLQRAATFRGGRCLASSWTTDDWHTPVEWCCAFGHSFTGSATLILRAGHWCPTCLTETDETLERTVNPFLAQVIR